MRKIKRRKNNVVAIWLICLLFLTIILLLVNQEYNTPPSIFDVKYANKYNEDRTRDVTLYIKRHNINNIYCQFVDDEKSSNWIMVKSDKCSYGVKTKKYSINLKYNGNKIVELNKSFNIDGILGISFNNKRKYIALGETFNLDTKLDYVGNVDTSIKFKSSDPNIISVSENGDVTAHNVGTVKISAYSSNKMETSTEVTSTDLLRAPVLDNNKPKLPCNAYSADQVKILDEILASEVKEAGEGTRAAAAVTARFLTLRLPYKVPYFYENGRLTSNGMQAIVEGEGRYYKKGIYVGPEKESEIKKVMAGPASWGCPLMNYEDDGYRSPNQLYPNGLDCSGYVSWLLVNAGLDLGDIGAGINPGVHDYTDVGELRYNSYDLLHSGQVKVGDLIGWDGHIAMIGAMSDTNIYVTESLLPGVIMDEYDYSSPYSNFYRRYDYIIDMSNNYKGDGNLKNMW